MHENIIVYNFDKPMYTEIFEQYNVIKNNFNKEYAILKEEYQNCLEHFNMDNLFNLIRSRKNIVWKYLKNLLDLFPQLKEIPLTVFFHGSYAKGTNRWYSDIDLNFIYPEEYKKDYFAIEEIISYLLTDLFDMRTRDHIHNMMKCSISKYEKQYLNYDNYQIIFNSNNKINYHVRPTKKHTVEMIYNSSRNIKDFLNYLEKNIKEEKINEWYFSFITIPDYDDYHILEKIKELNGKITKTRIIAEMNKQKIELQKNIELEITSKFFIQNLNNFLKINILERIQKALIIYNTLYIHNAFVNLGDLYNYLPEKFQTAILRSIWLIMRIEELCHKYQIDFSHRSLSVITYSGLAKYYENEFAVDFTKELNYTINNLLKELNKFYEGMKVD